MQSAHTNGKFHNTKRTLLNAHSCRSNRITCPCASLSQIACMCATTVYVSFDDCGWVGGWVWAVGGGRAIRHFNLLYIIYGIKVPPLCPSWCLRSQNLYLRQRVRRNETAKYCCECRTQWAISYESIFVHDPAMPSLAKLQFTVDNRSINVFSLHLVHLRNDLNCIGLKSSSKFMQLFASHSPFVSRST